MFNSMWKAIVCWLFHIDAVERGSCQAGRKRRYSMECQTCGRWFITKRKWPKFKRYTGEQDYSEIEG